MREYVLCHRVVFYVTMVFKSLTNEYGETLELIDYSPEIDKYLRIICFPTFKGHCGCMLFDICDTKMPMENAAGDRAVLMYLRKMMN